jgi:hypothetical protein
MRYDTRHVEDSKIKDDISSTFWKHTITGHVIVARDSF